MNSSPGDNDVFSESGAGVGSSIADTEYAGARTKLLDDNDDVWASADMVLKVKEPVAEECHRMQAGQAIFTYLHVAADRPLTGKC